LIWIYFVIDAKIENRPIKQNEFQGVRLGDSKEDVLFKKGKPTKDLFLEDIISTISKEGGIEKVKISIQEKEGKKIASIGKHSIEFDKNEVTNELLPDSEIRSVVDEIAKSYQNTLSYTNAVEYYTG